MNRDVVDIAHVRGAALMGEEKQEGPRPDPFPADALTGVIRATIQEITHNTQAPMGLVGNAVLAHCSLAVQHLYDVEIADEFKCPTSLFCMTIAESGERKSSVGRILGKPFNEHDTQMLVKHKEATQRWFARHEAWRSEVATLRGEAAKKQNKEDRQEIYNRIENLATDEPPEPRRERVIYMDTTNEKLLADLGEHWPSAGMMIDEGGAWLGGYSMKKDQVTQTQGKYSMLWSGEQVVIDRRGSDKSKPTELRIENGRLVIHMGVQEEVYRRHIQETGGLGDRNGFAARFLTCQPPSRVGWRDMSAREKKTEATQRLLEAFKMYIQQAHKAGHNAFRETLQIEPGEAMKRVRDFLTLNEAAQRPGGRYEGIRGAASKAGEQMARIAAVLHLFSAGFNEKYISDTTVTQAVVLSLFYLEQALAFGSRMSDDASEDTLQRLLAVIKDMSEDGGWGALSRRAVQQRAPLSIKGDEFTAALDALEQGGYIEQGMDGRRKIITARRHAISTLRA